MIEPVLDRSGDGTEHEVTDVILKSIYVMQSRRVALEVDYQQGEKPVLLRIPKWQLATLEQSIKNIRRMNPECFE